MGTASYHAVKIWRIKRSRCMQTLSLNYHDVLSVWARFCEAGACVLTCTGITMLWRLSTGECVLTFRGGLCMDIFEVKHDISSISDLRRHTDKEKKEKKEMKEKKDKKDKKDKKQEKEK